MKSSDPAGLTEVPISTEVVLQLLSHFPGDLIQRVTHWPGRKHVEKYNLIPRNIELVVVLVNYVNHSLSSRVKKEAKRLRLPVIYSRNSRHSLAAGGVLH